MVAFITPYKAQIKLAENMRQRRLGMNLTQKGLAERAGISFSTLRKFEQTGEISLASFLKAMMVLGGLEEIIAATEAPLSDFKSIDDVLKQAPPKERQRGTRK